MLPCPRCDEHLYPVPKFDLGRDDVTDFVNELKGFHEQFAECLQRSESREDFFNFMAGQFSALESKSIQPIALALENGNVRALQRFVSDAPWDDDKIMSTYRSAVSDDLGSPDGVLIFDESGFVKKGQDSVGPELCRGLANSGVFAPESGLGSVPLTPNATLNGPPQGRGKAKPWSR